MHIDLREDPTKLRYQVRMDSLTGHACCFEATVIDTHTGDDGEYDIVCECLSPTMANKLCDLLNEGEKNATRTN